MSLADIPISGSCVIVLLGFPNSGKTSLFNRLTNSRHKTVNYPGSTVNYEVGQYRLCSGKVVTIIDTPGLRTFNPNSPDEQLTLNLLQNLLSPHLSKPVHLMVALDATQLSRQLILAYQLSHIGVPMTLVLTKQDRAKRQSLQICLQTLKNRLNCPVFNLDIKHWKLPSLFLHHLKTLSYTSTVPEGWLAQLRSRSVIDDYAWTEQVLKTVLDRPALSFSRGNLDQLILHPVWGGVCFLGIMSGLFWSLFSWSSPLIDLIDMGVTELSVSLSNILPIGYMSQFLTEGLVTGMGAFLVFTPQIFLLFFLLGILEDTGYLSRGAVIVDRPLSLLGLSGKSFVPLLSGCACAIPAMMSARTISNVKERLVTLFVIPLMTCAARLPVYGLLITLLLGTNSPWSGWAFTGIYVGSFMFASITAAIVGRFVGLNSTNADFEMELPMWHVPQLRRILYHSMLQTWRFCRNAGPVILVLSVVIWVLSTFPSQEHPFIHTISFWLDPLFQPMGVDGRVGIGLLLSFAAREVFVAALAVVFAVSEDNTLGLMNRLTESVMLDTGMPLFTTSSIIGLLIFFMIAMQCMSTVAVAKQEFGSWRLPIIMTGSYIMVAYVLAVAVVQGLRFFGVA